VVIASSHRKDGFKALIDAIDGTKQIIKKYKKDIIIK